ncbi:hypothetical protein PSTG_02960 [Puccinia striiformis f. sp. tritici PST-78]|uniref:Uncharacterized protein n=1 Tax=Puccinia striiformis f. sp. tritici PST-78 TaxID=1165861 RepID=A0A0L0VXW8_9BASI|nr:hypothetical protein PSTG_02960 [Puccinia striiformis f. sp. tritici PST-78]
MADPAGKKHCLTNGLMEQLRARASLKRPPPINPSLSVFLWESPPLAQLYKITFLVRLEADGQEGLGFRFDDTISEKPRQIAWGGMVGTLQSPRCFLDGSQTFLTDSAAKPIERCRRGWHVRIGKVSQIVSLFQNTPDSLMIRLSLRKVDPDTHITHLPQSTTLETTKSAHENLREPARLLPPSPSSTRKIQEVVYHQKGDLHQNNHSKVFVARPKTHHIISVKKPTDKTTSPSKPIKTIKTNQDYDTTLQEITRYLELSSSKIQQQNVPFPISNIPLLPSPSRPNTSKPIVSLSTPPIPTSSKDKTKTLGEQSPSVLNSPIKTKNDVPTSPPLSKDSVTNQEISSLTPPPLISASDSNSTLLQTSPLLTSESVCFFFPHSKSRQTLLIPYTELIKVEYLKLALESGKATLSIDQKFSVSSTPEQESRKFIIKTILKLIRFIPGLVFDLQSNLNYSITSDTTPTPINHVKKIVYFGFGTTVSTVSRIGSRLVTLSFETFLETFRILFSEIYHQTLPDHYTLNPPKSEPALHSSTWIRGIRQRLNRCCHRGLSVLDSLSEFGGCLFSWFGLEEQDQEEEGEDGDINSDDHQCLVPGLENSHLHTFVINHITFSTFCGLFDYLKYGAIKFKPLHTNYITRKAWERRRGRISEDESKEEENLTDHTDRLNFMNANSRCLSHHLDFSVPPIHLTASHPASIYVLANRLDLVNLKKLANRQILYELSPFNIYRQLQTASIYDYRTLY